MILLLKTNVFRGCIDSVEWNTGMNEILPILQFLSDFKLTSYLQVISVLASVSSGNFYSLAGTDQ